MFKKLFSKKKTITDKSWHKSLNLDFKNFRMIKHHKYIVDGCANERKLMIYRTGFYSMAYVVLAKRQDETIWYEWGKGTLNLEILDIMGDDILDLLSFYNEKKIEFSLTTEEGVDGKKPGVLEAQFKRTYDNIYFHFMSPLTGKTGKYKLVFERNHTVIEEHEFEVSPEWEGISKRWLIPSDEGKYTLMIFSTKDGQLVSKGNFEVIK